MTSQNPNTAPVIQPLSPQDERTWAMLAHLSTLLNLVTGFLGVIAAGVIYLVYRERSRYVAYQSLQSLLMQLLGWFVGGLIVGAVWTVTGMLSAVIVGICLIPFAIVLSFIPLGAIVYGVIGAIKCNNGEDFRYWLIGDWARNAYTG
jgi:uncharacterized Tic20 family protein